eukprot:PhM_4_TR16809/c0_g2_i5/m.52216
MRTKHTDADKKAAADALHASITEKLTNSSNVLLPLHVRHHWTTAIVDLDQGSLRTRVYDSAPSPITKRDIIKVCSLMGLRNVSIICVARQPRGSNECGLHVLFFAMWLAFSPTQRF